MTVAIYARVSTTLQAEEGYSISAQVADCEKYASTHLRGRRIVSYIDDGYSGAYLERPALERLREALSAKVHSAVVCYDPDRLARGLSKQLILTEEIEKSGATLHFVNHEYKNTPEGQLFFQIRGAFSGYEREKIKERSLRGKREKLKQGKEIQGTIIQGYIFNKETSSYIINENEAKIVRRIFEMYLDGVTGGFKAIATKLNNEGIPTCMGKRWESETIFRILKNERYTGEFYAFKRKQIKIGTKKTKVLPRPKEEWIKMTGPMIIPREMFDQAQAKMKSNHHPHIFHRDTNHPYLLSGLAYCSVCGKRLTSRNGGSSHTKDGKPRYYYTCPNKCFNSSQTDITDDITWETLLQICLNKDLLVNRLEKDNKKEKPSDSLTEKEKKLTKIKEQKQTIMSWHLAGVITMDDATAKLKSLTDKENELLAQIAMLSDKTTTVSKEEILSVADEIIANPQMSYVDRRKLIVKIIDRVYLKRMDNYRRKEKTSLSLDFRFK